MKQITAEGKVVLKFWHCQLSMAASSSRGAAGGRRRTTADPGRRRKKKKKKKEAISEKKRPSEVMHVEKAAVDHPLGDEMSGRVGWGGGRE